MVDPGKRKHEKLDVTGSGLKKRLLIVEGEKPNIGSTEASGVLERLDAFLPRIREANQELVKNGSAGNESVEKETGTITMGEVDDEERHVEMQVLVDDSLGEIVKDSDGVSGTTPEKPRVEIVEEQTKETD
ncbi:hypothetical protein NDN08_008040 [Rhodosorus marinus]|uniref:Uncharacterized protein n=1 Tax=Rhodosorus marinus TaxID=101924 RepID=A0AAV8V2U9_9RHOD|nr:hypothetical protein NDN08_008040 [Rhodosorus marinus]